MNKKQKTVFLIVWLALIAALVTAILLLGFSPGESESIKEVMRDGVLHDTNKVSFFGLEVSPALISAYVVTAILLVAAALLRIFAIPKFSDHPGKVQTLVETVVGLFDDMAYGHSPHRTNVVAAYIFSAGIYVCVSTLFELFGIQVMTTRGTSIALPAPLADINGAIGMGVFSYLFILIAGIVTNGLGGAGRVLKDFSLPISMSFRLFGALLSGMLVTELVYHFVTTSFVLPVIVGVLFTLLHAVIQTYVLTTLVAVFYGEAVEPKKPKTKKLKG